MSKATKSPAFIMAVGALVNALTMLVGYLLELPLEFYPLAAAVIGAGLAVWRSGVGLPTDQAGYSRLEVLSSIAVGTLALVIFMGVLSTVGGCATITRDNPRSVSFDFNRKTCALWVDVDGERAFEVNPGAATKCAVKVAP